MTPKEQDEQKKQVQRISQQTEITRQLAATPSPDAAAAVRNNLRAINEYINTFRMVGTGVSGDFRKGYCVRRPPCEEAAAEGSGGIPIPPPPTPTGACCNDGDCSIDTETHCESVGGTYQGDDTTCDPNPCPPPTGACCVDTDCTIETEEDCTGMGGTYQGNDTTCDPNPCATGACCKDDVCDIETQAACEGSGGVYQGDGTDCDPNPCAIISPCDCTPFGAFDGSLRYFRTLTITTTGTQSISFPFGSVLVWEINWSSEKTSDCHGNCSCTGTGTVHTEYTDLPPLDCTLTAINCIPTCPDGCCKVIDGISGCGWSASPEFCVDNDSISHLCACCGGAGGTCCEDESILGPTTKIGTYDCSDPDTPCKNVSATITYTLSDECTFS